MIDPLLQLGGFPTFDHWVASGNKSGGWLYEFHELPTLSAEEIKNLTNRESVLGTQIQYNNLKRSGKNIPVLVLLRKSSITMTINYLLEERTSAMAVLLFYFANSIQVQQDEDQSQEKRWYLFCYSEKCS